MPCWRPARCRARRSSRWRWASAAFGLDLFVGAQGAASAPGRARGSRVNIVLAGRRLRADLCARRPEAAARGQDRAGAADRRGDRPVPLPHRVPAAGARLRAGAADRLGRRAFRAAGPRPRVLRRRGLARPALLGRALHRSAPLRFTGQSIAVYRRHRRLHRRAVAVLRRTLYGKALRATAVNRLGARLVGISHHAVRPDRLPAGVA